ncbi:protein naked cuticle homolog 2 [Ctenodactylus gundi]
MHLSLLLGLLIVGIALRVDTVVSTAGQVLRLAAMTGSGRLRRGQYGRMACQPPLGSPGDGAGLACVGPPRTQCCPEGGPKSRGAGEPVLLPELPSGDLKEGPFQEDPAPLEVVLLPEKAEGREVPGLLPGADGGQRAAAREGPRGGGKRRLDIDALQCDVSVEEDNRQEWTFTLYDFDNSGKVTREDMSSLMHTIYEVVDASVHHSSRSSKTLRVKLTVSPAPSSRRREGPPVSQDRDAARGRAESELAEDARGPGKRLSAALGQPSGDPQACPERGPYCVDENTERRNHYLDLAGIENYTSKFGPGSPPEEARQDQCDRAIQLPSRSRSQESEALATHHRRSQVLAEPAVPAAESTARSLDAPPRVKGPEKLFLRSPKGPGKPPGALGSNKPGKLFGYHLPTAPLPQTTLDGHHLPQPPPQPPPPPYGHKRHRQKGREGHSPLKATHGPPSVVEHELVRDLPPTLASESHAAPVIQRHHHHHEHHHHHFHHHHHPS